MHDPMERDDNRNQGRRSRAECAGSDTGMHPSCSMEESRDHGAGYKGRNQTACYR
ncbi:MAG: hypothetical protein WC382_09525 [Methanoregulaceae archaeon]